MITLSSENELIFSPKRKTQMMKGNASQNILRGVFYDIEIILNLRTDIYNR
jgi:hypothetical protein